MKNQTSKNVKSRGDKISESKRHSIEYVKNYIASMGCEYMGGFYKNNSSKISIKFSCGHINTIVFGSFQQGTRCGICISKINHEKQKKPIEDILLLIKENNLIFIEFPEEYKNQKSKITYKCFFGHITTRQLMVFYKSKRCKECAKIKMYQNRKGSNHPNWSGGTSELFDGIKKNLTEWKKDSIKNSSYKCIITNDRFDVVHHLYGFNMILREALDNLKINERKSLGEYSNKELEEINEETKKLHKKYPLGVCLRKDVHILFHKIYGSGNNTPEQFYEFQNKIATGEILI